MTIGHVVVVGGSKGLGRVIVDEFLARGYRVSILSRSVSDAYLQNKFVNHVYVDLESLSDLGDIINQIIKFGDRLDYLVFCQRYRGAGDTWDGEIRIGLTATKIIIDGFSEYFVTRGDRAIGVVSSVYAQYVGGSQPLSYHVVKAGLNQLIRYYAKELGNKQIRINGIMPLTYIKSESEAFYLSQTKLISSYEKFVPLARMGRSQDSSNAISFLCSEKANFITGQSLFVDGGVSVIWPEELGLEKRED